MRIFFLSLIVVVFSSTAFGQSKLKKKFRSTYEGTIPSYQIKMGQEIVEVNATSIQVTISKDSLFLFLDKASYAASFELKKWENEKKLLAFKVQFSEERLPEIYLLETKNKVLTRKGLYPQPDVELKLKKK
jgi:hypothetical protein